MLPERKEAQDSQVRVELQAPLERQDFPVWLAQLALQEVQAHLDLLDNVEVQAVQDLQAPRVLKEILVILVVQVCQEISARLDLRDLKDRRAQVDQLDSRDKKVSMAIRVRVDHKDRRVPLDNLVFVAPLVHKVPVGQWALLEVQDQLGRLVTLEVLASQARLACQELQDLQASLE